MSFAGFRKQLNKANQFLSEQIGGAASTPLDNDYHEMEKKVDAVTALVDTLVEKTYEYLQPNPLVRAKMGTSTYLAKAGVGAAKTTKGNAAYPQPEGELGDAMAKYGREIGSATPLGRGLIEAGEAFHQMADIKYALEDNVKHNFLDPLQQLQNKDFKEVAHHRKKLMGHRLDYDCKKRQKAPDDEMVVAEEKLEASKKLAETAMYNVIDNDVEQLSQLAAFVAAKLDFHKQNTQVLEALQVELQTRIDDAARREKTEHVVKNVLDENSLSRSRSPAPGNPFGGGGNPFSSQPTPTHNADPWGQGGGGGGGGGYNSHAPPAAPPPYSRPPAGPSAQALYDFDAENAGELGFREGDMLQLISQIDENWYEGRAPNGKTGFFPINYVRVVVPLPR